ncbi:hypothetical protein H6G64_02360 [Calothrix sp. FACHB-156]|nr:hypothetical protein [Calothrix sp. FACHB-156]
MSALNFYSTFVPTRETLVPTVKVGILLIQVPNAYNIKQLEQFQRSAPRTIAMSYINQR